MTDVETRVREAFNSLDVPDGLDARTLASIDRARTELDAAGAASSKAAQSTGRLREARVEVDSSGPASGKAFRPSRHPRRAIGGVVAAFAVAACCAFAFIGIGAQGPSSEASSVADFQGSGMVEPSGSGTAGPPDSGVAEPSGSDAPMPPASEQAAVTAYVTIDVNPSIELAVDAEDIVLDAYGLNDDGAAVLAGLSLAGLSVFDALDTLALSDAFAPYLQDDSYVAISVTCDLGEQRDRIMQMGESCLASLPCQGSCKAAGSEERAKAFEQGMGVQRYRAAEELMALDESLTWEDCVGMSMREMRDRIAELS